MRGVPLAAIAALVFALATETVRASVVFTFTEVGANISMTSAGTLTSDTTNLVAGGRGGWGGVRIEQNGESDVMGGTLFGQTDVVFGFHEGTDFSPRAGAVRPMECLEPRVVCREWNKQFRFLPAGLITPTR